MSTKRNRVPELQRQLLMAGIKQPNGRLRFAKGSTETLATTYAALLSLQRKKLIEPEKPVDPSMMTWKVTKAGKAAVAEKPGRR
jgi:D-alanyl-D-alanine carboxypeptidase